MEFPISDRTPSRFGQSWPLMVIASRGAVEGRETDRDHPAERAVAEDEIPALGRRGAFSQPARIVVIGRRARRHCRARGRDRDEQRAMAQHALGEPVGVARQVEGGEVLARAPGLQARQPCSFDG
jgi:hypothetical protein